MQLKIEEEILPTDREPPPDTSLKNMMPLVKCLECHCIGKIMNTSEGVVLRPDKVKKTLVDLGGGLLLPNLRKIEPTVKSAFELAKDFLDGFNQATDSKRADGDEKDFIKETKKRIEKIGTRFAKGIENAKGERKMKLPEMMMRETTKTQAPKKFTGFLSDEFERDIYWKSKKRLSFQ